MPEVDPRYLPQPKKKKKTVKKKVVAQVPSFPVPVICAVNGVAAGAGANIALACDIVIAAKSAKFIQAFAKIGLMPDAGGTWTLPRLVGAARGIDQWAIEWLREQNETCWAVVPYTLRGQPKSAQAWLEQVDRIIELQLPQRKSASAFRNRYMVDLSQIVFGFWSGKGGGTIKTLRHALRKRKEVHGIPMPVPDAPE